MLFRESTAMLVKPVMGHSLQRHANVETPLVGSVRLAPTALRFVHFDGKHGFFDVFAE